MLSTDVLSTVEMKLLDTSSNSIIYVRNNTLLPTSSITDTLNLLAKLFQCVFMHKDLTLVLLEKLSLSDIFNHQD